MSFRFTGLDNVIQKIVPNFDGTATIHFTWKGVQQTYTFPWNNDFTAYQNLVTAAFALLP